MPEVVVSLPDDHLVAALDAMDVPPGVSFVRWPMDGCAAPGHIDIVVPPYFGGTKCFAELAKLPEAPALVQWQSIGVDGIAEALPGSYLVANATSVHETATAELALGLTLAAQRGIVQIDRAQAQGQVRVDSYRAGLADRRVLLIGFGGVGKAIARRLAPFEVQLTAVASHARVEGGMDVHAIAELPELLPTAEIVIVAVPLTGATVGLVNAEFLAALPDNALVVNVARGKVADTDAIVAEVGRLRFALDVTDPEPLPAGHPLYGAPGVIVTPHIGGDSSAMEPRMAALLVRQVRHFVAGEPFENVVIGG